MKPPVFEHHVPRTLGEALQYLKDLTNARVIAGGQSLMPMLNFRVATPDHLVDLNNVEGMAFIREEGDDIVIGAMTAQRTIEFSDIVKRRLPLMAEAILSVGHRQTRNRGTIGGSLCHLDPSAELPLVARAFDASISVASLGKVRSLSMAEFAVDMMTPAIEADEAVTEIRFKPWPKGHGWAFTEYARRKGDFAIVSVAAMVMLDGHGRISRVLLALGGVNAVPIQLKAAEDVLLGERPDEDLFVRATAHCADIDALDDPFAPAWYRKKVAARLSQQVLAAACRRADSGQ
jgi:aerobic carbon-monoxide dehydrogenase medium subunit